MEDGEQGMMTDMSPIIVEGVGVGGAEFAVVSSSDPDEFRAKVLCNAVCCCVMLYDAA